MEATRTQSNAARPKASPFTGYAVVMEDGCEEEVHAPDGRFYRYSGDTVAFYCCNERLGQQIKRRLRGRVTTFTEGDGEYTFHMPNSVYEEVARLAGVPRKPGRRTVAKAH